MTVDSRPVKFTPALPGQPVPEIGTISGGQPVFRAELPDGRIVWLVSGYENVRQMIIDQRFSRALAVAPGRAAAGLRDVRRRVDQRDGPTRAHQAAQTGGQRIHRPPRRSPAAAGGEHRQPAHRRDGRPAQPADLVAGFSLPLPAQVICEMLGVPAEDLEQFHAWSDTIMGDWQRDSGEIMTALAELYGYFGALIEIKRDRPADDLMSALIAARDDADRLSEHELTVMGCTLLIGGHETTANQINLSLLLLLDHPGQVATLRADPELIPAAVEELLRCTRLGGLPPARVTIEDVQLGGVTIPAGEQVMPLYATANRDPSVFTDPDRFDVTRDAASHLAFGAGVHHCLGAQLARVELQEAFRGLIGRLPGLRLAVPASELEFKPGMAIHSLRELPVLWGEP